MIDQSMIDLAAHVERDGIPLRRAGQVWQGRCPFHADDSPSFTIYLPGRGWFCFGCGRGGSAIDYVIDRAGGDRRNPADIRRACIDLGITPGTPRPLPALPAHITTPARPRPALAPPARDPDAVYPYCDPTGALRYQVVRWDLTPAEQAQRDGAHKMIRQRRPIGAGGWVWNLGGVEPLLYNLPALLAADPAQVVYVCEGEKDADCLSAAGLLATCNSGGAGHWPAAWSHALAGRHVVILPDHDEAGRHHAEIVAAELRPVAARVTVLALPGLAEHGDVSDFLDAHTLDALACLVAYAPALPAVDPATGALADDAPAGDVAAMDVLLAQLDATRAERDALQHWKDRAQAWLFGNAALDVADRFGGLMLQTMIDEGLPIGEPVEMSQKEKAARFGVTPATMSRQLDRWAKLQIAHHQAGPNPADPMLDAQGNPRHTREGRPMYRNHTVLNCTAAPFDLEVTALVSPLGKNGMRRGGGKRECPSCHADGEKQEIIEVRRCRKCACVYTSEGDIIQQGTPPAIPVTTCNQEIAQDAAQDAPPATRLHDATGINLTDCEMQPGSRLALPEPDRALNLRATGGEIRQRATHNREIAGKVHAIHRRHQVQALDDAADARRWGGPPADDAPVELVYSGVPGLPPIPRT